MFEEDKDTAGLIEESVRDAQKAASKLQKAKNMSHCLEKKTLIGDARRLLEDALRSIEPLQDDLYFD